MFSVIASVVYYGWLLLWFVAIAIDSVMVVIVDCFSLVGLLELLLLLLSLFLFLFLFLLLVVCCCWLLVVVFAVCLFLPFAAGWFCVLCGFAFVCYCMRWCYPGC